jgi:1,2-diacylglycerol 3-beta-glucosyltransferase
VADGLAIASLLLSACALAASVYIAGFAVYGVSLRREPLEDAALKLAPSFLVLIPAHNEAAGIGATIQSVLNVRYPREQLHIVTIADNCTDGTATIARELGAETWERKDAANPGKGQALQWEFFNQMANFATADQRHNLAAVYQGRYDFAQTAKNKAKWFESFTLASKAAENSFVYRPRSAAGLVNLLQGNGFCISRAALLRVPFRAGSVVEDAEYAVHLAIAGVPVRYVEHARVFARMTESIGDASPQRVRWASGIFSLIGGSAPELLRAGIRRRSWRMAEATAMLLLTSRVLLVSLTLAAFIFATVLLPRHIAHISLGLAITAILLQAFYMVLMFRRAADHPFPMADLAWAPFYFIFVSLMQALALAGFRRKRWSRTVR